MDEVREVDLLIHVIDVDHEQRQQRIDDVNEVIELIGATHVPQVEVYNKIDHYPEMQCKNRIDRHINQHRQPHFLNLPVTAGSITR